VEEEMSIGFNLTTSAAMFVGSAVQQSNYVWWFVGPVDESRLNPLG